MRYDDARNKGHTMIRIACSCGNVAKVDDTQGGRKGTCRNCGTLIHIPFVRHTPPAATTVQPYTEGLRPEMVFLLGAASGSVLTFLAMVLFF